MKTTNIKFGQVAIYVFMFMKEHKGKDGIYRLPLDRIASHFGITRVCARKAINQLIAGGCIIEYFRPGKVIEYKVVRSPLHPTQ